MIDSGVVQSLGLFPTGTIQIHTPTTGPTPCICNQYDISLVIAMGQQFYLAPLTIPVCEAPLSNLGIHALIGRDVLANSVLIYNGKGNVVSLAF